MELHYYLIGGGKRIRIFPLREEDNVAFQLATASLYFKLLGIDSYRESVFED